MTPQGLLAICEVHKDHSEAENYLALVDTQTGDFTN